jgi:hypothetical protein
VYLAVGTGGSLGAPNAGDNDAALIKFDSAGNLVWSKQIGTGADDRPRSLSIDGSGNVYMAGFTAGDLGGPNAGAFDMFVSKFDPSGNLFWVRQLGTNFDEGCCDGPNNVGGDTVGVAADAHGNVYVASFTGGNLSAPNAPPYVVDAFVAKYDPSGSLRWIEQFGTGVQEVGTGVSIDGQGYVYASGSTECHGASACALDGLYAFVAKYRDDALFAPPGDFSADGAVNAADYVVWRKGIGTIYTQTDYEVWRAHFGQTAGSSAAHASVPEPSVVWPVLTGLGAALHIRRSRQRRPGRCAGPRPLAPIPRHRPVSARTISSRDRRIPSSGDTIRHKGHRRSVVSRDVPLATRKPQGSQRMLRQS